MNALHTNGEDRPERPALIPPHIAWPLFIVFLLALSVGAALFTAYMANSDGGVELVDDAPFAR